MREQAERKISDFITPPEQEHIRAVFEAVARKVLTIGDADLRHQTEIDWATVQDIRRNIAGNSKWNAQTEEALEQLEDIIGSGSHTTLGKVYASFAAVDIVQQTGGLHNADFTGKLVESIRSAPTEQESILLTAALYSRYMALLITRADSPSEGQRKFAEYDAKLLGLIDSPLAARRRIAVHTAAEVFASEIHEDEFGMRLPEAILSSSFTENSPKQEVDGDAIPQSVMYLQSGHLVSWNKLQEATMFGIPGAGRPEQRIPQILVGVEVAIGQQTHEHTHTKLGYVAMRAIRRPRHGLVNWTHALQMEIPSSFSDEKLSRYCSFDSLSLIAAIRIARDLYAENSPAGFSTTNILRKVNAVMERFQKVYPTAFGTKNHPRADSILTAALGESQRIDGNGDWDETRTANHLKSQIIGLLVSGVHGSRVMWRNESELWELYLQHVIRHELTREDKLEMLGFLLQDTQHELWRKFDRTLGTVDTGKIVQWACCNEALPPAIADKIIGEVDRFIVQRCETIRDIHIPHIRSGAVLSPDDAE